MSEIHSAVRAVLNNCNASDISEMYDSFLDDAYGYSLQEIEIFRNFSASEILKNCDKAAYNQMQSGYRDSLSEDGYMEDPDDEDTFFYRRDVESEIEYAIDEIETELLQDFNEAEAFEDDIRKETEDFEDIPEDFLECHGSYEDLKALRGFLSNF